MRNYVNGKAPAPPPPPVIQVYGDVDCDGLAASFTLQPIVKLAASDCSNCLAVPGTAIARTNEKE
jgi:hypothetical protein